jgi:hypothetical protein
MSRRSIRASTLMSQIKFPSLAILDPDRSLAMRTGFRAAGTWVTFDLLI